MKIENLDGVRRGELTPIILDDVRARMERERRRRCLDKIDRNVVREIFLGLKELGEHESDVFERRVNQCCGESDAAYRNLVAFRLYINKYRAGRNGD